MYDQVQNAPINTSSSTSIPTLSKSMKVCTRQYGSVEIIINPYTLCYSPYALCPTAGQGALSVSAVRAIGNPAAAEHRPVTGNRASGNWWMRDGQLANRWSTTEWPLAGAATTNVHTWRAYVTRLQSYTNIFGGMYVISIIRFTCTEPSETCINTWNAPIITKMFITISTSHMKQHILIAVHANPYQSE